MGQKWPEGPGRWLDQQCVPSFILNEGCSIKKLKTTNKKERKDVVCQILSNFSHSASYRENISFLVQQPQDCEIADLSIWLSSAQILPMVRAAKY